MMVVERKGRGVLGGAEEESEDATFLFSFFFSFQTWILSFGQINDASRELVNGKHRRRGHFNLLFLLLLLLMLLSLVIVIVDWPFFF